MVITVLTWLFAGLAVASIPFTAYNMWKKKVCDNATHWYRTGHLTDPKPKDVLTFERRWASDRKRAS